MREMKDSGIEWIGKIPTEWKSVKLKYICECITDYTASGSFADLAANVQYLDDEDYAMLVRTVDLSAKRDISRVYVNQHAYNYLRNSNLFGGELILPNIGSVGAVYIYAPLYEHATLAPNAIMLRSEYNRYLYYLLSTQQAENALKGLANATTQIKFNKTQLRGMNIILPPVDEQRRIAEFLDARCAEIDELTVAIEREIATLGEYRRSVITESVTRGLDPATPLKDSGVEWIGKIPADWSFPKITHILDYSHAYPIGDGDHGTIKANDYAETGIPFIRVQNLGFATELSLDNIVYITEEQNATIKNSTLRPNDVLFAKTGATIGKVGIVPPSMKKANTTSHVGKITLAEDVDPKFIYYELSSHIGYKQFWDIAGLKSTRPELSIDEIKTIHVILPSSKAEQSKIVAYLDARCAEIDGIIAQKREQLARLAEYRKSIIYEYVTGKREVR